MTFQGRRVWFRSVWGFVWRCWIRLWEKKSLREVWYFWNEVPKTRRLSRWIGFDIWWAITWALPVYRLSLWAIISSAEAPPFRTVSSCLCHQFRFSFTKACCFLVEFDFRAIWAVLSLWKLLSTARISSVSNGSIRFWSC